MKHQAYIINDIINNTRYKVHLESIMLNGKMCMCEMVQLCFIYIYINDIYLILFISLITMQSYTQTLYKHTHTGNRQNMYIKGEIVAG